MSALDPGALFQNNLVPVAILTLGTVQTQQAMMYVPESLECGYWFEIIPTHPCWVQRTARTRWPRIVQWVNMSYALNQGRAERNVVVGE